MRFVAPALLVVFIAGCATSAPEPKLPYNSVFRAAEQLTPVIARADAPPTAPTSMELQAALVAFAHRARKHRQGQRGHPMPSEQIQNWDAVMTAVDGLLARPIRETSSYDVIRSRVTMEAELEMDARLYAELPDELYTAIELRKARLGYRMAEVRRAKVQTQARVARPDFIWPVSPVAVTSLYGRRLHPITRSYKPHEGLDLAAGFGQEVYAAAAGTVLVAEWVGGHGNHVRVQHAGNIVTTYSHLADILVEPGTMVKQGQPIGLAGSTGLSTGVHLHFELHVDGKPMDPLDQMGEPSDRHAPVASR